jgi:ammonium transporter Rh
VFLWVYWPSFVGGVAPVASSQQGMAFVNTILSLSSSSIFAFVCSGLLTKHHKFRPVDIQNATLAGGVAIGCVADLTLSPGDAILIGCFAGLVSSVGYQFIQPYLENKIGLHDTCGIHNLHGMPSLVGATSSVLLAASKNYNHRDHDSVVYGNNGSNQWWYQLIAIGVCVGFAVISGTATGLTLKAIGKRRSSSIQPSKPTTFFNDAISWEVAPDFNGPVFSDSGRGLYSPAQIA